MASNNMLRKSLAYAPEAQETALSAQRQIAHAVAPYAIEKHPTQQQLSFLLTADTAVLTRDLSIPPGLTDVQVAELADFIIKRGDRPFERVKSGGRDFVKLREELLKKKHGGRVDAYEYEIDFDNGDMDEMDVAIGFPDYTRVIWMTYGEIANLPSSIVELDLQDTALPVGVIEDIQDAKSLKRLVLRAQEEYSLRGLPIELEVLNVPDSVLFLEGYAYDCPHLKELCTDRISDLPDELIEALSDRLVRLEFGIFVSDDADKLSTILTRATGLKELYIAAGSYSPQPHNIWEVASTIEVLSFYGIHAPYNRTKPLVNLLELDIDLRDDIEAILTHAPHLEKLTLHSPDRTKPLAITAGASFSSLRRLHTSGVAIGIPEAKRLFPSLVAYTTHTLDVNYVAGIIEESFDGTTSAASYVDSGITSYVIKLTGRWIRAFRQRPTPESLLIHLPANTRSFTIEHSRTKRIYDIDSLLNATADERARRYVSLDLDIKSTNGNITASITAVAKPLTVALDFS